MGLVGPMNVLAIEGARNDIRVNAISPIASPAPPPPAALDVSSSQTTPWPPAPATASAWMRLRKG
jgi:NAD(P)-dependent dehydrogenase (short-subunit alcohol dehydrogenase family)